MNIYIPLGKLCNFKIILHLSGYAHISDWCTPIIYSTTYSLFSNTNMPHMFPILNAGLDKLYGWLLLQEEVYKGFMSEVGITCFMCSHLAAVLGCIPHSLVENSQYYLVPYFLFVQFLTCNFSYLLTTYLTCGLLAYEDFWDLVASLASPHPPHSCLATSCSVAFINTAFLIIMR